MVMKRMYTDDTKTFFFLDYHKSLALMQSFDNITSILDTEEKKKVFLRCARMIDLETHLNAS